MLRYASKDYLSLFTSLHVHSTNPSIKTLFFAKNFLSAEFFFTPAYKALDKLQTTI